jgi:hypothetical protein
MTGDFFSSRSIFYCSFRLESAGKITEGKEDSAQEATFASKLESMDSKVLSLINLSYNFAPAFLKTALSCEQCTQALPSFVLIIPLTSAVFFPAATTSHSILTVDPIGTGLVYVQIKLLLTWPASKNPGFAIVKSAVEVRVSRIVAAAPPCRFPPLLHSDGVICSSHTVDCVFSSADMNLHCRSGPVSKPA